MINAKKNLSATLLLVAIFLLSHNGMAQGYDLQFNRAVILTNGTAYTVPADRVWKIESAVYTDYSIGYSETARVTIDGTNVELIPFSFSDGNGIGRAGISTAFPMWLPANTIIKPIQKTSKLFAIEFILISP